MTPTASGVAVDASGNLFITNSGTHQILRMDHTTGLITVVAGNGSAGYTGDGGSATNATLNSPLGGEEPNETVASTDALAIFPAR